MTFSELFVRQKLSEVEKYQGELGTLLEYADGEILRDTGRTHIAERLLQLIVDTLIDINQHLIKELGLVPAEDFQSTFSILAQHGVLRPDFVNSIAPVVGLRNRVVHRYETLDKTLFIAMLRKNQKDFAEYVAAIDAYVTTQGK